MAAAAPEPPSGARRAAMMFWNGLEPIFTAPSVTPKGTGAPAATAVVANVAWVKHPTSSGRGGGAGIGGGVVVVTSE